jgi:nucleotidyltransferase/DNA polymerase involved in DNA repair
MNETRTILHVDMDAFFASVEQRDHPELRGKPVLVGGSGPRGVVAAASYEARVFGCRSAMPSAVAKRLCPHAVFVKGSFEQYKEDSRRVMEILGSFSPLVQPVSIDEAFVDVSGSTGLFGSGVAIGQEIRRRVKSELLLTCSVGVAPNKFLAKLASDLNKPDGLAVISMDTVRTTLDPLPVSRLWGVGPAAEKSLHRLGVRTIRDLHALPKEVLRSRFDDFGEHLWHLARGLDDRAVHTDREAKSISHEHTFAQDLEDADAVRAVLADEAEQVARRLRKHARFARTVTVKIRFGDFETVTRSATLEAATDRTDTIAAAARSLFDHWAKSFRPVRLIGVGVSNLSDSAGQSGLFDNDNADRKRAVDQAADAIAAKFGKRAVQRASSIHKQSRHGAHGPGSDTPAT